MHPSLSDWTTCETVQGLFSPVTDEFYQGEDALGHKEVMQCCHVISDMFDAEAGPFYSVQEMDQTGIDGDSEMDTIYSDNEEYYQSDHISSEIDYVDADATTTTSDATVLLDDSGNVLLDDFTAAATTTTTTSDATVLLDDSGNVLLDDYGNIVRNQDNENVTNLYIERYVHTRSNVHKEFVDDSDLEN